MLDRAVVNEFLDSQFQDAALALPPDISKAILIETFSQFTEDDLAEWLKDNFKSFFNHGNPDWAWIRGRIAYYQNP